MYVRLPLNTRVRAHNIRSVQPYVVKGVVLRHTCALYLCVVTRFVLHQLRMVRRRMVSYPLLFLLQLRASLLLRARLLLKHSLSTLLLLLLPNGLLEVEHSDVER